MKKKITKEMLEEFSDIIANWKWDDSFVDAKENKHMRSVYAADRRNLNTVYNRIVKGEYENAGNYAMELDTILRDLIPNDIYDIICG